MWGYGALTKKLQSITNKLYPLSFIALLLILWKVICKLELVPTFMLPSPASVVNALITDFPLLMRHSVTTFQEAIIGLFLSVVVGVFIAIIMDRFSILYKAVHPVIILTQTVPTIAIAPLLVLWMGFGIAPKITLIFLTCFFPIVISTLSGLRAVDPDLIRLMESMGASPLQILIRVKLKSTRESFFAGLRVAATYAVVGAVISEWLGGMQGLGVYMTRVRKSYAFDKMFAVIFLISIVSLIVMKLVDVIEKKAMPWKYLNKGEE